MRGTRYVCKIATVYAHYLILRQVRMSRVHNETDVPSLAQKGVVGRNKCKRPCIKIKNYPTCPTYYLRSFAIGNEDHTLGNALRRVLMQNADVEFAG